MAPASNVLTTAFQALETAIENCINDRMTAQDNKIAKQQKSVADFQAEAQLLNEERARKDEETAKAIRELSGQVEQLNTVFAGMQNDCTQMSEELEDLKARIDFTDGRIERRTSKVQFNMLDANFTEVKTKTAGLPDQIVQLSSVVRKLQEDVSQLKDRISMPTPTSDVIISDVPSEFDLFEPSNDLSRRYHRESHTEQDMFRAQHRAAAIASVQGAPSTLSSQKKTPMVEITAKTRKLLKSTAEVHRTQNLATSSSSHEEALQGSKLTVCASSISPFKIMALARS